MIYCVEDDQSIREIEIYTLKSMGFEVKGFEDAASLFAALKDELPKLIILDVMLPVTDGIEILKSLKANPKTRNIAVIMATARDAEIDRIKALNLGADDYLVKPFSMLEMAARAKAVLRRTHMNLQDPEETLKLGDIVIDNRGHTVTLQGRNIELTLKEFNLLYLLCRNAGRVFTRDELLNKIWGQDYDGESRTVDMHIKTLRHKLGKSGEAIKTVRGIGYKMEVR